MYRRDIKNITCFVGQHVKLSSHEKSWFFLPRPRWGQQWFFKEWYFHMLPYKTFFSLLNVLLMKLINWCNSNNYIPFFFFYFEPCAQTVCAVKIVLLWPFVTHCQSLLCNVTSRHTLWVVAMSLSCTITRRYALWVVAMYCYSEGVVYSVVSVTFKKCP